MIFKHYQLIGYQDAWQAMQEFVSQAHKNVEIAGEEIWFMQHPPVFTLGQAGKHEHILHLGDIPLVQSDRGGQVTYHGPGQLLIYFMLNLRQRNRGVKWLVESLEQLLIDQLHQWGIPGERLNGAPGVYVHQKKIASLGLRVRHGWTYHGLSLNVKMDLRPFNQINPCGMKQLPMTQLYDYIPDINLETVIPTLEHSIKKQFYSEDF